MEKQNSVVKTILIVDDEPHILALLEETLEDFTDSGVRLLMADNGEKGLELTLANRPDLILMDVMMPKMNGYDLCRIIKGKSDIRHAHVILLTAKGQEVDKEKGCEVGADDYVTKPFDPDEIIEKASEVLGIKP